MLDEVEMSVRDLAFLMMSVSDNTATDVLQALVGTDRINERLRALGINSTYIRDDCASLLAEVIADLGGDPTLPVPESSTPANPFELDDAALREAITTSPALTGKTGNTSTPRDITTLLSLIWSDRAGSPEACAEVRRIMGLQFAPHRLSTAYGDGPSISGKTGTLVGGITNEAGVIDFGNGEAYAVAVFLRKHDFSLRNAAGDRAVGDLARLVIDSLRS
jgi:beta-lactamase class A